MRCGSTETGTTAREVRLAVLALERRRNRDVGCPSTFATASVTAKRRRRRPRPGACVRGRRGRWRHRRGGRQVRTSAPDRRRRGRTRGAVGANGELVDIDLGERSHGGPRRSRHPRPASRYRAPIAARVELMFTASSIGCREIGAFTDEVGVSGRPVAGTVAARTSSRSSSESATVFWLLARGGAPRRRLLDRRRCDGGGGAVIGSASTRRPSDVDLDSPRDRACTWRRHPG